MKLPHVLYIIYGYTISAIFPQLAREKGKMLLKDRRLESRKAGRVREGREEK